MNMVQNFFLWGENYKHGNRTVDGKHIMFHMLKIC